MSEPSPILNNPYEEPRRHYWTNPEGELDYTRVLEGRRPFVPGVEDRERKDGISNESRGTRPSRTD